MKELIEAYQRFPEWFTKTYKNVRYVQTVDFSHIMADPFIFSFNFDNLKMRIKLNFDRFEYIYRYEGNRKIENTYLILSDKIYNQFFTEFQKEFQKRIKGENYYE
jgi:hypothetical protein